MRRKRNLWKQLLKRPSTQVSGIPKASMKMLSKLGNYKKDGKFGFLLNNPRVPKSTSTFDSITTAYPHATTVNNYGIKLANPLYNYLLDNCITRTTLPIRMGSVSGINIQALSVNNLLMKGQKFWIYNCSTFTATEFTSDKDHSEAETTISISTQTVGKKDWFPSGSFIIPDNRDQIRKTNESLSYKLFTLTNAEYTALATSPYILLSGVSGATHLPISAYIRYVHGADETAISDLYIGHNSPTTTNERYWGSIDKFAYRYRNSALFQMGASTYGAGAEADFDNIPVKSNENDGTGLDLKLYTTINFVSASSYIQVALWYKTIKF